MRWHSYPSDLAASSADMLSDSSGGPFMHILLSNDDGYQALGLRTLARRLTAGGHRVTVVAPNDERSGQSHAMSFFRPILVRKEAEGVFSVSGTPADCVAVALLDILSATPPDLVISGINHGPNVGWDVNYSGTVGAATEAALLGYRAMATSMDTDHLPTEAACAAAFDEAAGFIERLVAEVPNMEWPRLEVLNVNHPGRPPQKVVAAACGAYSMYMPKLERLTGTDERHRDSAVYLIGGSARRQLEAADQDVAAIQQGCITLSFLQARQSSTAATDSLARLGARLLP